MSQQANQKPEHINSGSMADGEWIKFAPSKGSQAYKLFIEVTGASPVDISFDGGRTSWQISNTDPPREFDFRFFYFYARASGGASSFQAILAVG